MRDLLQDVAYFFRTLAKSPGFFAVAVLTLALGIGANTAIFSIINAVLLKPLPFREPDQLVRLFETEAAPGRYPFAGPDYLDWQAQNRTLEGTSLFTWGRRFNVSGGGQPESALSVQAEVNFFEVLGARPLFGRTFTKTEGDAGGARVAVLSYGFWQRHFGGDLAIIDKPVELNAEKFTIVGVMPSWFNYPRDTELWTPLDMSEKNLGARGNHSFLAIGRLKPGVTVKQAEADLSVIAKRLEQQYPNTNEKVGAAVVSMREQLTGGSREPLLILLGAVTLVLLVACANVANLLLIRAGGRRRELAIRSALGAGRWRVVRQLLTESLLLAFGGGAAGLAAAWWGVKLLPSAKALPIPLVNPVRIDVSVLLFTLGAAVLTGLLFGVLPALQATAMPPNEELKSSGQAVLGASRRGGRLRDAIAVAEMAVSLALLVGAGLLLRTFNTMQHTEIGIESRSVLTAGVNLPEARYPTLVARRAFFDRLLERLGSTPGVEAVSASAAIPLEGGSNGYITVPGRDDASLQNQLFEWNWVTASYFRTFGIRLVQGRNFSVQDEDEAGRVAVEADRVYSSPNPAPDGLKGLSFHAVVNRTMARLLWPKQDPIGRVFQMGGGLTVEVIGVAADVKARGIRSAVVPQAYFPLAMVLSQPSALYLDVKTTASPMTALGTIRAQVATLDPTLALIQPRSMDDVVADGMQDTSLQTWLLGSFAMLAVLLAGVGLYSVMAFLVAQRRHEIGIRVALGAGQRDLLRLVMGHAARLTAIGILAGLAAAFWLTRLLQRLLFGVTPNDVGTFAGVTTVLVLIALAACAIPARRAMRVNPIVALRYE